MTTASSSRPSSPDAPQRCILITGGAGFIGSNFVHHWCAAHPGDRVIVLDALTYAGNRSNLATLDGNPNLIFVQGDICDADQVAALLKSESIDTVAHFAAESHVDRSILGPGAFIQTNVVGTFTLLEQFRQHWLTQEQPSDYRFLHVSTDEVYGSLAPDDPGFSETTPFAPNSPYSASKAGSDHLVRAYFHTYGLPTLITNCSNNYGPFHFPEKLIPLMIINMLLGKPLPVYGDGQNIRDWLYVEDHCRAIDRVMTAGAPGETYNVGGNNEVKNLDLVQTLCDLVQDMAPTFGWELPVASPQELIQFVKDRPGHDRRYAIDATKIQRDLNWEPEETLETGLQKTVAWYLSHRDWWQPLLSEEYQAYYSKVYT